MNEIKMKAVSSLEKCFFDEPIESKAEIRELTAFKNERIAFQALYFCKDIERRTAFAEVKLTGDLAEYATVRNVVHIPATMTADRDSKGAYLRTEPGLYPDLLRPLHYHNQTAVPYNVPRALWVEIRLPDGIAPGEHSIGVQLNTSAKPLRHGEVSLKIKIIDAELPKQTLIHTEWFYTDCIANHYHLKAFSEKHWEYIENFMRTAVENGINMILTPVFTPELDTYIGGERLTTQLVDITLEENGKFSFEFSKLHRWIDMAERCGVEYYEIPHFFTQWGAKHAPKIIVKVKGRKKKYFGWHTDALGEEYAGFLSQFIPALLSEFRSRGLDKKCFFHVSDEPRLAVLDHYKKCKELIGKYLEGYPIIDALSEYEFYESGAADKPIPFIGNISEFIEHKVPGLWAYYAQSKSAVSNRLFAMPLCRTRIIGVQLYLYNIEGFLHWGYNFYNNGVSHDTVDPFLDSCAEFALTSGDTYVVYPGDGGKAWESLRLNAMREAMDDIRALRLYEEKFGREATERLILEGTDGRLDFLHYPNDPSYLTDLREKIYKAFE